MADIDNHIVDDDDLAIIDVSNEGEAIEYHMDILSNSDSTWKTRPSGSTRDSPAMCSI